MEIIKRPLELFWEWIHYAWQHQRLEEDLITEEYLMLLLERFLREDRSQILHEPLLQKLYVCLNRAGPDNFRELRQIGDASLFTAGILAPKLEYSLVDVRHYIKVGESAYCALLLGTSDSDHPQLITFQRFAEDLRPFVRVLSEIGREHLFGIHFEDILTVWERYLATNDERDRRWLLDQGVLLLPPSEKKLII